MLLSFLERLIIMQELDEIKNNIGGNKIENIRYLLGDEAERALRYAFSLPLSTVIVGMESMAQLEQNLAIAENFKPMTDGERLEFFRDTLPLVKPDLMPWKTTDWEKPEKWVPRRRGLEA